MAEITFDDFLKLEIRVGKIIEACAHPDAEKLLLLKVDIGEKQIQLVAGIRTNYLPDELIGKHIAVLTNLQPRTIRGQLSQGMLLAASGSQGVSVLTLDKPAEPGSVIK